MTDAEIQERLDTLNGLREQARAVRETLRLREADGVDVDSDSWNHLEALSVELDASVAALEAAPVDSTLWAIIPGEDEYFHRRRVAELTAKLRRDGAAFKAIGYLLSADPVQASPTMLTKFVESLAGIAEDLTDLRESRQWLSDHLIERTYDTPGTAMAMTFQAD